MWDDLSKGIWFSFSVKTILAGTGSIGLSNAQVV